MAEEKKSLDELDVMIGIKLISEYIRNELNPPKEELAKYSNNSIGKFVNFEDKKDLRALVGDFTELFFGDKSLKMWSLAEHIKSMPKGGRYALKKIGELIKQEGISDEEKAYAYIAGKLGHFKRLDNPDQKQREESLIKLDKFFKQLGQVAEKEYGKLGFDYQL